MSRYDRVFLILCSLFIASLIIANAFAFKLFDIDLPIIGVVTLSMGILPYPITFLVTDLISELYGRRRADVLVLVGFGVSLFFLFFIIVGRYVPVSHVQDPAVQEHYMGVFGQGGRAILGSMTAYLLAQFLDVRLFHFLKRATRGRHLWLRNNGSTLISQLVDTIAVVTILFHDQPSVPLLTLIGASYAFKLLTALVDTPFFYLGVALFKDIERETERRFLNREGAFDPT